MGRKNRELVPNGIYHVAVRINAHHRWFEEQEICQLYLTVLFKEKVKNKFKTYAFCLMPTHLHLVIQSNDAIASLPMIMQQLNVNFTKKFHVLRGTRGHFWRARYFSRPLRSENEVLGALCYVANNPVKAKLTHDPLSYTYNSIRHLQDNAVFEQLLSDPPLQLKQSMMAIYNIAKNT